MPAGECAVFLQAVGRDAKEENRARTRRPDVGRDARVGRGSRFLMISWVSPRLGSAELHLNSAVFPRSKPQSRRLGKQVCATPSSSRQERFLIFLPDLI